MDFFLNNQPDALIIQIYCYKTLHVSGIFSAHHQEFSKVYSGCSILTLLGHGHQKNLHETYQCRMYNIELLMMGREDVRNM